MLPSLPTKTPCYALNVRVAVGARSPLAEEELEAGQGSASGRSGRHRSQNGLSSHALLLQIVLFHPRHQHPDVEDVRLTSGEHSWTTWKLPALGAA
mmetsp:Transcript_81423/g.195365  ORF Transcript_81423/g.195365 Transcript_81423/m.195365 type:complete len:96 (-) Transcript_81423:236-523(-)